MTLSEDIRRRLEPAFCKATVVNGNGRLDNNLLTNFGYSDHIREGFVSTSVTVAMGLSTHRSYRIIQWSRSYRRCLFQLKWTSWFSFFNAALIYQKSAGINRSRRQYCSTMKPSVGNWHGPWTNKTDLKNVELPYEITLSVSSSNLCRKESVCKRVNAAPMRRSNSVLASTASDCRISSCTKFRMELWISLNKHRC